MPSERDYWSVYVQTPLPDCLQTFSETKGFWRSVKHFSAQPSTLETLRPFVKIAEWDRGRNRKGGK